MHILASLSSDILQIAAPGLQVIHVDLSEATPRLTPFRSLMVSDSNLEAEQKMNLALAGLKGISNFNFSFSCQRHACFSAGFRKAGVNALVHRRCWQMDKGLFAAFTMVKCKQVKDQQPKAATAIKPHQ